MTDPRYPGPEGLPPLVWRAVQAARQAGFEHSCSPAAGRLLRRLAAAMPGAQVLETGTGAGVGAAWLLSGMDQRSRLVTIELDRPRAATSAAVLAADARATVLAGDWRQAVPMAPFDLAFIDGGPDKEDPLSVLELLTHGSVCVLDDLTPEARWTPELRARYPSGDPVRLLWSAVAEVDVEEVALGPDEAALVIRVPPT